MLYEILRSIKNFFPCREKQMIGRFTISDNVVEPLVSLLDGQYFLIEGSVLNDGVHLKGDELNNETFYGVITPLAIPKEFLALVAEIEEFAKNDKPTTMQSESFGGYSYTKATNNSGQLASWQDAFATRLNAWRKI